MTTGSNVRSFTYLGSGQASKDIRDPSNTYTFTANKDGQQQTATLNGTDVGTYTYNGLRQRASKSSGGLLTKYLYDLSGHLIAETNNATGAVVKEYLWLDDMPVAVVDDTGASPVLSYIQTDHLGTPQKITDGSAAVVWDGAFDPFGNAASITGSITNNLRFPGQYFDTESGLSQNWNRDYDPTIGRYIESDPIGLLGGTNTYSYVDNPFLLADPYGLAKKRNPNSEYCVALKKKIENVDRAINGRYHDLFVDKKRLPYYPPYSGAPRRASVQGHVDIIQEYEANLEKLKKQYEDECGCDSGSGSPQPVMPPAPSPDQNKEATKKALFDLGVGGIVGTTVYFVTEYGWLSVFAF